MLNKLTKAAQLRSSEELKDLLSTLAGYLPHSYLTDKILQSSSWPSVWKIIRDHYNVQVTSESLLDFESLHKLPEETHRQYFERLLQHTKQHLAPADSKVENVTIAVADKMTISLMNMVALQWLRKTNPALIEIVKTEYSTELRANEQLADLVPRIAPNIDSLLRRYDQGVTSNKVTESLHEETVNTHDQVSKTFARGRSMPGSSYRSRGGGSLSRGGRGGTSSRDAPRTSRGGGPFCPGCFYLSQQLGTTIHFRHTPGDCPRKATTVKLLEMEDNEYFDEITEDDEVIIGKFEKEMKENETLPSMTFQTSKTEPELGSSRPGSEHIVIQRNILVESEPKQNPNIYLSSYNVKVSDMEMKSLILKVLKLGTRQHTWSSNGVRKAKSPCLPVLIENTETHATVDEGSEINCLDEGFATKNGIRFERTDCKATAAGSTVMKLSGQTNKDITIKHKGKPIMWKLGRLVVVKNLGVDLLVGEPAKSDNEIVTFPHQRLIEMWNSAGKRVKLPYFSKVKSPTSIFQCKAPSNETIYPSAKLRIKLPVNFWGAGSVIITPKNPKIHSWLKPHEATIDGYGCVVVKK